jgi:3-deoxy-D-manno-octulosonic-acid transferase
LWVHALSVGEVLSAIPLVKALKENYPYREIVFTVTTRQGMEVAREELGEEIGIFLNMPLDFWWSMRRIVRYIRPVLFILIETDIWPGLIASLKKRGLKTILINGRISQRTFRSYKRCRILARLMFQHLELILMQTDLDRKRLLQIGIPSEKMMTVGNIKFDRGWVSMGDNERHDLLNALHLDSEDRVWVAGSTHEGEESTVLDVFGRLRPLFPTLRLIMAPRDTERAAGIQQLCMRKGFKPILRTAAANMEGPYDVLILNTIGELGRFYGIGEISFVGGSLVAEGGHNLLEPASFGRPVLFGPHTDDFAVMSQLLVESGGGEVVKDADALFETMRSLLTDKALSQSMGKKASGFVEMNKGALKRVMGCLDSYVDGGEK